MIYVHLASKSGRHEIGGQIGRGAAAFVFWARDPGLDTTSRYRYLSTKAKTILHFW